MYKNMHKMVNQAFTAPATGQRLVRLPFRCRARG
jgi:hypothetical protein